MENTLPNLKKARNRTKEVFPRKTFYLEEDLKTIGKGKLYYVRTYGCQNNVRDGENIKGLLEEMGYKETSNFNKANIVILNTCAVRENAEKKVFGEVGFLKNLTKKKDFIFGICGCMAQEENVIIEIIQNKPYINFVFGTFNLYELPQIIKEYLNKKKQIIRVNISQTEMIEDLPSTRDSQVKGYVNISYGCDKFCTYCIVPYTRGKLRSRSKEDILKEVNDLVKKGYKEVVLLGQNVNSYGVDKNDGYTFVNLLEDVCKTNIERVRFTSNNP
jgi:tRNA-2-methylthio-N6-dimethylallyladenosine synthase